MRRVLSVLALVWLVSLPGLTARRVSVWISDLTLWSADAPGSSKPGPWINLGVARYDAGDLVGAEVAVKIAQSLAGSRPPQEQRLGLAIARANLAYIYFAERRYAEASAEGHWLQATHPDWPQTLSVCLAVSC